MDLGAGFIWLVIVLFVVTGLFIFAVWWWENYKWN